MFTSLISEFKLKFLSALAVLVWLIVIFVLTLILFFGAKVANEIKAGNFIGLAPASASTIQVTGEGRVYASPDMALLNIGVVSEAGTVKQAQEETTKKMNEITGFLKKQKLDSKDLKTTSFSIRPIYSFDERRLKRRTITAFEVRQSLEVKVRDFDKLGVILEEVSRLGANEVSGPQFTIEDKDKLEEQARDQAIRQAKQKARELARQLDVRLVRIAGFNESGSLPIPFFTETRSDFAKAEEGAIPSIEPGENKITKQVTISYEITSGL